MYVRLETLYLFVSRTCLLLPAMSLLLISTSTQMFITKSIGTETLMLSHIVYAEKYIIKTYVSERLNRKPINNTHQTNSSGHSRNPRASQTPCRVCPHRPSHFDRTPDERADSINGSKRHSLQAVELSQRTQAAVQIVSNLPVPSNGGPIYCFFWHAGHADPLDL